MNSKISFFRLLSVISCQILVACVFLACGDDDATYTAVPELDVTATDILFESSGGTGSVTTTSTGALQAESTASWLTVQVQGSSVSITAPYNPSLHGRSARVNLRADGRETAVMVTQKGMVFDVRTKAFVLDSNAPATVVSEVTHMLPVTVETDADWLTPVFDEQTGHLSIALSRNTSGTVRSASVHVYSGEASDHVSVTQYDLTEDIFGYYSFDFRTKEGEAQSLLAIVQPGEMEVLFSSDVSFYVPLSIDADAHTLEAQLPAYVGRYAGSLYTYLLAAHERMGSPTDQVTSGRLVSPATFSAVQTAGQWQLQTSVFGGSWERYNSSGTYLDSPTVDMWVFDLYTARVSTTDDWTTKWADFTLLKCCRPRLTKLSNAEGEAWLYRE